MSKIENAIVGLGCIASVIYGLIVVGFWLLVAYGVWLGILWLKHHA